MDLYELLDSTLAGLGYELIDVERISRGKLLRVFIDKSGGISVDDCVAVSNHLSRLFAVENIDYDRLEVSSPGLTRPLRKPEDFLKYRNHRVKIKTSVPVEGRRNFKGIILDVEGDLVQVEVDGRRYGIPRSLRKDPRHGEAAPEAHW